jgi:hypothetical protein
VYAVAPTWAVIQERALLWFAGFGIADALMLLAAVTLWTFGAERLYLVDAILEKSPNRVSVTRWLARAMDHRQQLRLPLVGATLGPIYLAATQHQLIPIVEVGPTSFLMTSWTGFIGGSVVYWLWVVPGAARKIYRCPQLSLRWHDPASTPGLRVIGEGMFLSALFLLAGVVTISMLGFCAILLLLYFFFALSVATCLRLTAVPFYWIWRIATRAKARTLSYISAQLDFPNLYALVKLPSVINELIGVYRAVATSQDLPFSTAAMVQYAAALGGAVAAFMIGQFMSGGPGH